MIATYEFYTSEYFGKLLISEEFPEYATRADAWLSELTFGRYASPDLSESQLQAVKMSECAVAEICYELQAEPVSDPSISKETVGSHSVTYRTGSEAAAGLAGRIYDAAARYLLTTGLLYRGAILEFKL